MTSRCPVPVEQQPINEYQDVRESWFYSWAGRDLAGFLKPVIGLWLLSWAFAGPIAAASFHPAKQPLLFCLSGMMGAFSLPILALVQLYIGWSHVGGRLRQQAVPYEESGWYDGQVWVKPEDVVIAISFPRYSSATVKAAQYCRRAGATVIGLTDSRLYPLGSHADFVLEAKSDMVSLVDSLVAPMSVINALIVAIAPFSFNVGAVAFNGIALGTVAAIVVYHLMSSVARARGTA